MDRASLGDDLHVLLSPLLERSGFLAAFTERTGGVSEAPYSSLNLGLETGDDRNAVQRNRDTVREALETPAFTNPRQVHGNVLIQLDESSDPPGEADGIRTSAARFAVAVLVADCVPLILASEQEGSLAAIHLGWRGIASGLVQIAASSFRDPGSVVAAIGPSIGPCHYEVGGDVAGAVDRGTGGHGVTSATGERPRLDLAATVEATLRDMGVKEVDRAAECTACEPERFFSHRRDGRTGRQALVAMRL